MSDLTSRIIRASAGTGKTYQLTRQILHALGLPGASERPERLLAMTFTRAAAGEIRDRILGELAAGASSDAEFAALRDKLPPGTTRADVTRILLHLVDRLDRLRISTIDAFFMTLARAYAFDLEMPADWRIADDLELKALRLRALEDVWEGFAPEEVATVLHHLSQGAPSPRVTDTLVELLEASYEVVRDTAPEAWDWLEPLVRVSSADAKAALQALDDARLGGTPKFDNARIADIARFESEDWKAFLNTGLPKAILAGKATYGSAQNILDGVICGLYEPLIDYGQAQLVHSLGARTREIRSVVLRFEEALRERRQASPLYGFTDVAYRLRMGVALGILDVMAYRLDGRLDHLLIDEFQDTSLDQWDVLRPLARSVTSGGEEPRSFMCVGDVKQSLYAWRGGRAELLERVEGQLPSFAGEVLTMAETRRSSPIVLALVNQVFANVEQNPALRSDAARAGARRWATGFEAHTAFYDDRPGVADLRVVEDGEDPLLEAAKLAREIHVARPEATIGILVRGNSKGQVATLVRALGDGTPAIAATGRGGNPLSDSVAVELMLSLLTFLDHPGHSLAGFHIWRSPLGRLVATDSRAEDPVDHLALSEFAVQGRERLLEVGYARACREWMEPLLGHADAYDIDRLSQLLDLLAAQSASPTLRPGDTVRIIRDKRIASASPSAVQVMTVHQAKGLEFDVVILPDLGGDLVRPGDLLTRQTDPLAIPDRVAAFAPEIVAGAHPDLAAMRDDHTGQCVHDALCVLYVALTRAKHATHCIISPSKPSEKALRTTYAGILRGACTEPGAPAPAGACLWTAAGGIMGWRGEDRETAPVSAGETPAWTPPKVGGGGGRNISRTSPSRLEGDAEIKGARVLEGDSRALVRGTVFHGWLEDLTWLVEAPEPVDLVARGVGLGASQTEAEGWSQDFLAALGRPTLRGLLTCPDGDLSVRVEQPFEMTVAAGTAFAQRTLEERTRVSGSIDRLVVHRVEGEVRRVQVIDYKSDRIDGEDARALDERVRHYAPQLAVYRLAAARLLGCPEERVEGSLMFLHSDLHVPCA
jgi:ATP-dependent helicase/nuclease subunit A